MTNSGPSTDQISAEGRENKQISDISLSPLRLRGGRMYSLVPEADGQLNFATPSKKYGTVRENALEANSDSSDGEKFECSQIQGPSLIDSVLTAVIDYATSSLPNTSKSRSGPRGREEEIEDKSKEDSSASTKIQSTALQWDFRLPRIELDASEPEFSVDEGLTQGISTRRLVSALQGGMKRGKLQHYLSFFSEVLVIQHMNVAVAGFPAFFYAVETNDEKIVRAWATNGGDVNCVDGTYGIPLLGFAIMIADSLGTHTTAIITTLLSLGADISVMPRVLFTPCLDDPSVRAPFDHRYLEFKEPGKLWCRDYMRPVLASRINLTQRYFLEKTLVEKKPSERQTQVATTHNALSLLGIGYFMVGQSSAAKMVIWKCLSQLALPRSKPLVMVFAGMLSPPSTKTLWLPWDVSD